MTPGFGDRVRGSTSAQPVATFLGHTPQGVLRSHWKRDNVSLQLTWSEGWCPPGGRPVGPGYTLSDREVSHKVLGFWLLLQPWKSRCPEAGPPGMRSRDPGVTLPSPPLQFPRRSFARSSCKWSPRRHKGEESGSWQAEGAQRSFSNNSPTHKATRPAILAAQLSAPPPSTIQPPGRVLGPL